MHPNTPLFPVLEATAVLRWFWPEDSKRALSGLGPSGIVGEMTAERRGQDWQALGEPGGGHAGLGTLSA